MVYTIPDQSGLAQGLSGGFSALTQALNTLGTQKFNQHQKQQEFQNKRNLEEEKRLRISKSGKILSDILQEQGTPQSLQDLLSIQTDFIDQGGDMSVLTGVLSQNNPFLQQEAISAAGDRWWENTFGGSAPGGTASSATGSPGGVPLGPSPGGNVSRPTAEGPSAQAGLGLSRMSDEDLVVMQGSPSPRHQALAQGEQKRREGIEKRNEALWNYGPTKKILDTIQEEAHDAEFGNEVADEVLKLVDEEKVSPSNLRNLAASKWGENLPFLFSKEAASLKFLEKLQAKGLKAIFPRPTEKEFLFINTAQAQLGKSDDANRAVANLQKKFNEIPLRTAEFAQEVIDENGGNPPRDIGERIRKKARAYKNSLITDSAALTYEFGDDTQRAQAKSYLDKVKSPVSQVLKTPTTEILEKIWIEAGKDNKKAAEIAISRGYDIGE